MDVLDQATSDADVLDVLEAALDALTAPRPRIETDQQLLALADRAITIVSRLQTWQALLLARIDAVEAAWRQHGTSTTTWLTQHHNLTTPTAHRLLRTGDHLTRFTAVADAATSGSIVYGQAEAIVDTLTVLPDDFNTRQVTDAELMMIRFATHHDSAGLRRLTTTLVELVDPIGADQREARRLEQEHERALRNRHLSFTDDHHGTLHVRGSLPVAEAEPFRRIIEAYAAHTQRGLDRIDPHTPRTSAGMRRADGLLAMVAAHQHHASAPAHGGDRPRIVIRLDHQRLVQAAHQARLIDDNNRLTPTGVHTWAKHHPPTHTSRRHHTTPNTPDTCGTPDRTGTPGAPDTPDAPGTPDTTGTPGTPATPETPDTSGTRGAPCTSGAPGSREPQPVAGTILNTGQPVDPATLRVLLCDADILPIVMRGASEILDVGRQRRLVTPSIRAALDERDQGCVFPGCDKPPETCHAHHIHPWWNGGETTVHNLVLVCPHHHGIIEPGHDPTTDRWHIRLRDSDGQPEVIPPHRVDPHQQPRQHARFTTRAP